MYKKKNFNIKIKCLICKESTEYLDDYKFHIKSDQSFFGHLKIHYCNKCDFAFANPMPQIKKLNRFYKYIYRDYGRPHHTDLDFAEADLFNQKNMNYIQYLSTFINFNKINNIFDYGSGSGDIGYLLKKRFAHLKLHTIENDIFSKKILKKRSYKIYNQFKDINTKFDLIICTHVLEHLTNLNILNNFKKILKKNRYMLIEVPNNLFNINFMERAYDSPHLIFFSKKTFVQISKKYNLNIKNLTYSSISIETVHEYMKKSILIFGNWPKHNIKRLIHTLKQLTIDKILRKITKDIFNINNKISYENFINGDKNSWCLRVLFKNT